MVKNGSKQSILVNSHDQLGWTNLQRGKILWLDQPVAMNMDENETPAMMDSMVNSTSG